MAKDSFVFYRSFYEALQNVPKKQRTEVYEAVFEYAFESREPSLSGVPRALWELIRPQLDASQKRYENAKKGAEYGKKGAEYGKLGGRPKKEKPPLRGKTENPLNVNVNENVNDNVNVNVNAPAGGSDTHIPTFDEIALFCNQHNIKTDIKKFMQYNEGKGWSMEWTSALALWVQKDKDKKKEDRSKNRFNNFENSEPYDFDAIERAALQRYMSGDS